MGAVYEAEQDQPRRKVALKLIKTAWASPDLVRRFEQEFQALGRLQHPCIAQIYDAGSADAGFGFQPFFAMELVKGQALTDYAAAASLDTRQRLALMIKICEAVEHAHQRGIIHRDLKPGNILVDKSGQPKILDFGLARMTDGDVEATRQTDMGQLLGTLPYMSPEQVTGDPSAVDTRSDVYALGVVLYELLAGKLPYQQSRVLHEMVHTIQQVDPAPLSSIDRSYRGDIETIVGKALEKEKDRRYPSAASFAEDIQRYLDDQSIQAKPATTRYQLRKFARRHRALVAGVAAIFLVLSAGIVASTWEAVQARRAEAHAQQERNSALVEKRRADIEAAAQAVNNFLQHDLLAQASAYGQAGPDTKPDLNLTVRTALDRAAARIQGKFDKQPEVEAAIRDTIGDTYQSLGLYPQAQTQLERALQLRRQQLGSEDPDVLRSKERLARLYYDQGEYAQVEALYSQTLEVRRRVLGPEHPDTLRSVSELANVYVVDSKYAQAEALYTINLATMRRVFGPSHLEAVLTTMSSLGTAYLLQGKYAQAEGLFRACSH